ncbi:MAG: hypothetical protein R3F20_16970 [Planctomycetota bacterium]
MPRSSNLSLTDELRAFIDENRGDRARHASPSEFIRAQHVLVGDILGESAYILAVWHDAMDFIGRPSELEPQILREAQILAEQIERHLSQA